MEERLRFVARLLDGEGMSEVCRQFGISRKTGKARGKSLGDLLGEYVEDRKKHGKKTWAKDKRRFELYVPSRLKARPACDVTRADILALHKAVAHAPYEANRTVETIRHAFNLGVDWGFGLRANDNPAIKIQKYSETKRKVWIAPHDFPYIARAIDGADIVLSAVLDKARFREAHNAARLNQRQIKVINRLLDGFEGKLTSSKRARLTKSSQDTANRDIAALVRLGILRKGEPIRQV